MSIKPEYETIGESFLQQYFSSNQRDFTAKFYGNDSILSVEKEKYYGSNDISDKLSSLSADYKVSFHEIQPSNNGILIILSGGMRFSGENNAINFTRVFFLTQAQTGSIYVKNDMFLITSG